MQLCDIQNLESMLDVGCGNQQARCVAESINPYIIYYGVDYYRHNPDTILCDFNKGEFPNIKVDVCLISGVMEFLERAAIPVLVKNVCASCSLVAVSCHFSDWQYLSRKIRPHLPPIKTQTYEMSWVEKQSFRMKETFLRFGNNENGKGRSFKEYVELMKRPSREVWLDRLPIGEIISLFASNGFFLTHFEYFPTGYIASQGKPQNILILKKC